MEHVEPHSNKLLGTVPSETMSSNAASFRAGDVLYGRMRPYLNKVARPNFDGLASAEFVVMPPAPAVDSDFLLRRISASDFVAFACGQYEGDRPRVKFEQLADFQVLLPPLAEQSRIAGAVDELLTSLDDAVQELEVARKKLASCRQSLLKAAVEGALTADWRALNLPQETGAELLARILGERRARWEASQLAKFEGEDRSPPKDWQSKYEEPTRAESAGLPSLPSGWAWASAEQLCGFITKGTTPQKSAADRVEKTVPFLRVTNLTQTGALDFTEQVFVSEATHQGFLARSVVYPGDLLMNIVGPPLGQVSVVPPSYPEWNVNQAIAIFRPVPGTSAEFLKFALLSPVAQQWLKARAKTTAGQTNLTLELCRAMPIPLPPIAEQVEVARLADEAIDALHALDAARKHALRQSAAQRQNILRAAFAGQLVPQDPADEPASVLLERIRAERAAQTVAPKARRPRGAKATA